MAPRPALKLVTKRLNAITVNAPTRNRGNELANDTQIAKVPIENAWPKDPPSKSARRPQLSTSFALINDAQTLAKLTPVEAIVK